MKTAIATALAAMTICIVASVGCDAAATSPGGPDNKQFLSDAPLASVVHFQDLDVSSVEGARRLYARLRRAANEVCEPLENASVGSASEHRACVTKVIEDAVADINQPILSEYHRSHTKSRIHIVKLAEAE